jgi:hypothetical protein
MMSVESTTDTKPNRITEERAPSSYFDRRREKNHKGTGLRIKKEKKREKLMKTPLPSDISHKRNPEKIDREYALHVNGKRTSLTEGEKEEGVIN